MTAFQESHRHIHACQPSVGFDTGLGRQGEGFDALPVRQRAEGRRRTDQVVQMGGTCPGQAGDEDGGDQIDVVDLRVPLQQVGEQEPVLEALQQLGMQVDDSSAVQAADLA
jgi:hypothetical protein